MIISCINLFSILGDSISTFEGTVPDGYEVFYQGEMRQQSGVRSAKDTWWNQAVRMLGGRVLVDNAWSGSRAAPLPGAVQRFPSGCSSYRTSGLHLVSNMPDVIIAFLGFNDWANGVPLYPKKETGGVRASFHRLLYGKKEAEKRRRIPPTFFEAYQAIMRQLYGSYPAAEIWCCTLGATCMRDDPDWQFPELYAGIPIGHYNDAIRTLARRFGAGIIDFAAYCGRIETVDGSHPTAEGMRQLATQVVHTLVKNRFEGGRNA